MKVILSKPIDMATISFKADDDLKIKLDVIAEQKGINTSAYIKLVLTKEVKNELTEMTENGLTVGEELQILKAAKGAMRGPFLATKELMNALKKSK